MINNVVLIGRLTRDVELRYTPSNVAVATFNLAVNRNFKNQDGEREADFINCVMWQKSAENLANWTRKGMLIGITGRIQIRSYENQQGQRVYVTEVVADNFQLLESRTSREGQSGGYTPNNFGGNATPSFGGADSSHQVPNFSRDENPFGNSNPMDISDDDLPF